MKKTFSILSAALLTAALAAAGDKPSAADAASAEAMLKQAKALAEKNPKDAGPLVMKGRAYLAQKRWGKARGAFDDALDLDSHCADAYYGRGQAYEAEGKLDEAANEYQAALKADSSHAQALAAWQALSARIAAADAKSEPKK
jgi:tetratricopeptide (TPR) repeat protein